jgi:hypothetical protein
VQRLLQLAWIASAASYQNPHTTTSVTKANKETPGTPILRPDQDGTLRRGVVTKRFNSQQVCVDYERLPVLMRELQPMPLTELESCIGSYSNYVRIAHVAYSAHNTINPETTRQHHLLFQLDPRQIFAPDVPLSDATKPSPNDSSLLVLTARGSRNPMQDRSDWVTNLSLGTKAVATHEGFSARADSVPLLPLLDHLRRGGSIMFTGHSLGSAVAELVCQRVVDACRAPGAAPSIASALDEGRVVFIGFASPAIGTCAFNELKRSDAKYFFHIVNEADVVPHITNLSVVYPQLWAHAVTGTVQVAKSLLATSAPSWAKLLMDVCAHALKQTHAKILPPLEPARGYHFVHHDDGKVEKFFVEGKSAPATLRTSNFLEKIDGIGGTIRSISAHFLEAYVYEQISVTPLEFPLWVPERGLVDPTQAWWLPQKGEGPKIAPRGRIAHHSTYRMLSLTLYGKSARWLATSDVHLRVTLNATGQQAALTCLRIVSDAGETPAHDAATAIFFAPQFQPKGCIVSVQATPRYPSQEMVMQTTRPTPVSGGTHSFLPCVWLTGPVTRVVDMSVLSTLHQALFLAVGSDKPNAFTQRIGARLERLERLVGSLAALKSREAASSEPNSHNVVLEYRSVGACRLVLPSIPDALYALVWRGDDEKSLHVLMKDGSLKSTTAVAFNDARNDLLRHGAWTIAPAADDEQSYDIKPSSPDGALLDMLRVKLSFVNGAYIVRRGGDVLDVAKGGWLMNKTLKAHFQKKDQSAAASFLIYCVSEPHNPLVPPCAGVEDSIAKCARVVVHREAKDEALTPPIFLNIVQNPDSFIREELNDQEEAFARKEVTAAMENTVLNHESGTRIVDVLRTQGTLPPAVPIHKLLKCIRTAGNDDLAQRREPPVSRYFFCGLSTITSWILGLCSVPPVTAGTSRGFFQWLLNTLSVWDTRDHIVDKTYVAQLEVVCSVLDDDLFNDVRETLELRQRGRVSQPKTLKELHRRLLEFHDHNVPLEARDETDPDGVLRYIPSWMEGPPLKLRSNRVPADRVPLVRLVYAIMVTVAIQERDVASCCAVAAFGLKGAGKSTLIHALTDGRIDPPTRGSDVNTLEAIAFFGQTPATQHVCVVDCPGTNEDRHELRCLQRLIFGVVKMVFVVQSLNKEAQNQVDILRSVLDNANPEATILVVFTRFASRFASVWQDRMAAGFELHVVESQGNDATLFEFDGHHYVGPYLGLNVSPATKLSLASIDDGVRLLSGKVALGDFRVASEAEAAAIHSAVTAQYTLRVCPYVPPRVTEQQFGRLVAVKQVLPRLPRCENADQLVDVLASALGGSADDGEIAALVRSLFPREFESNNVSALAKALTHALQKGFHSLSTAIASAVHDASQPRALTMSARVPMQTVEAIRVHVAESISSMQAACLALRRVPRHHCVIFHPRTDDGVASQLPLFQPQSMPDDVIAELELALLVDADTSAEGGTFRSDNELDVQEGLRLRLPLPNDPQYYEKQDKLAELFRHPAVAGRAVFNQDDLRSLLLSPAGATNVDPRVFRLLFGESVA